MMINCRQTEFHINNGDWIKQKEPWKRKNENTKSIQKHWQIHQSCWLPSFFRSSFQLSWECLHGVWACVRKIYFSPRVCSQTDKIILMGHEGLVWCSRKKFPWKLDTFVWWSGNHSYACYLVTLSRSVTLPFSIFLCFRFSAFCAPEARNKLQRLNGTA